ncbi:MAG: DNA-directed RNA polymerase subunit omega [Treponemataceae bacterium]|nr:MAG: DNA-directed RNA polymerase subunit omega [Treponemataceae bacterium]
MDFPLQELIKYTGNIYEITCAASRRAYQITMLNDTDEETSIKPVPQAASQLFKKHVKFLIETDTTSSK